MFRLLIDQNYDHRVIRALRLRITEIDVVFAQDVGLEKSEDPDILEWAASAGRIIISHDAKTLPAYAYHRLAAVKPMPGLIIVRTSLPVGAAINELLMILTCCQPEELDQQVYIVPL